MRRLAVCLALTLPIVAQVPTGEQPKRPARIREEISVIPSGWSTRIPGRGAVSAPGRLQALAPGQRIAFAVAAEGEGRGRLLEGRTLTLRISSSAGTQERTALKPVAIRDIKAAGSDLLLHVLKAGRLSPEDMAKAQAATTMVTLAVFEPAWTAPSVIKEEQIQIRAELSGVATASPTLKQATLRLRPWADWRKDPEPAPAELQALLQGFHEAPQPGRLLPMLEGMAGSGGLESASVAAFFAAAFREHPDARQAALAVLPTLDPQHQRALLAVMRPLGDPRGFRPFVDPVTPDALGNIGVPMDQCWGAWMATGDPSYVRALVALLKGAPDFPVYQTWLKTRAGAQGLNAKVANGLAYQIAGWSLASFQRTDPRVSDWLAAWQDDPTLAQEIRKQIASLPTNPALRKPDAQ